MFDMAFKNVNCPVDDPVDLFGVFSNAVRLTADGSEVLIDFCQYSEAGNSAKVVARVRVRREFLPSIQEKIGSTLAPQEGEPPILFIMPPINGES